LTKLHKGLVVALIVSGMAFAVASLSAAPAAKSTPLWPGAKFTTADRDRAVERAVKFIYSVASDERTFRAWGSDLLFAFANIATSNGDRRIAEMARGMGRERAVEWRRQHQTVPPGANATAVSDLLYGSYSANLLGVSDRAYDRVLLARAATFSVKDYDGFDPAREPPPDGVKGFSRRAFFMYAQLTAYFGEQAGTEAEGRYVDTLRWLPQMRPYPPHRYNDDDYYDAFFAITHVIYTYNHYNLSRVSPECFPEEFTYLKTNLPAAIADNDPETLGEYVDSLRVFGVDYSDPHLREATEYLLSTQNSDGSWGDPSEKESYVRYHTAWTGQGALQQFHWKRVLPCPGGKR
jgi:hypothetical protein